jgi:methylenetetrahydrofolate--tRNA-(uracil-5-)-methyltransferase
MKYGAQTQVFRMIPGLENAEFARLGGLHRNTFLNSPKILDKSLRLKSLSHIRFAGQITGCEGYVESASLGLLAGQFAAAEILGDTVKTPPETTALGALLHHVTGGANVQTFQPMNINFGLFPELCDDLLHVITPNGKRRRLKGQEKKQVLAKRALNDLEAWILYKTPAA